jgi:hypothetical protein
MKKEQKMINDTKLTNLNNVNRFDRGVLPYEIEVTDEGYIKGRCIVTRCGVFLYKNVDGTIRKELRSPEEVTDPESLKTIKMIPVVDGHPPEKLVNAENVKRLSVGYTGEDIEDDYPYVISNLVITDKATVEKIKDKKKNQLSLGYTVDLIPESGSYNGEPYDFVQKNIRYNHLALVDEARAGPEARIALDGEDAIEILKEGPKMAVKKQRKLKFDDTHEYMVDDDVGKKVESMMQEKMQLEKRCEDLKNEIDRAHAERDSMRDKDHHNPNAVHEGREEDREYEELEEEMDDREGMKMPSHMLTESEREKGGRDSHMKMREHPEEDEIGENGKEMIDPYDSYGMQSHVRDYEKPSHMRDHVVSEPKNKHYPHDLPHVAKVDQAEFNRRVKQRVRLQKLSERYLDKETLSRFDSLSDLDIKKKIILGIQKNAQLDGRSAAYINARFDSVMEDLPREKVIATPSRMDENSIKDQADAKEARLAMIQRQKEAYKPKARV